MSHGQQENADDASFLEIVSDRRIPPYGMFRRMNRGDVEVVSSETDDDRSFFRIVLVTNGEHEVWVHGEVVDEYGYDLRPDERVSSAELAAIDLKQTAIRDGSAVTVAEAWALLEDSEPDQFNHALVALYYAAKADSDVTTGGVDTLRTVVHEYTGHVDTSHKPTISRILDDVIGND